MRLYWCFGISKKGLLVVSTNFCQPNLCSKSLQKSSYRKSNCLTSCEIVWLDSSHFGTLMIMKWFDLWLHCTAQKMKFSIKNFFSKYDHIRSFLRIWSHLLKKSLMENLIFFVQCWWQPSFKSTIQSYTTFKNMSFQYTSYKHVRLYRFFSVLTNRKKWIYWL